MSSPFSAYSITLSTFAGNGCGNRSKIPAFFILLKLRLIFAIRTVIASNLPNVYTSQMLVKLSTSPFLL